MHKSVPSYARATSSSSSRAKPQETLSRSASDASSVKTNPALSREGSQEPSLRSHTMLLRSNRKLNPRYLTPKEEPKTTRKLNAPHKLETVSARLSFSSVDKSGDRPLLKDTLAAPRTSVSPRLPLHVHPLDDDVTMLEASQFFTTFGREETGENISLPQQTQKSGDGKTGKDKGGQGGGDEEATGGGGGGGGGNDEDRRLKKDSPQDYNAMVYGYYIVENQVSNKEDGDTLCVFEKNKTVRDAILGYNDLFAPHPNAKILVQQCLMNAKSFGVWRSSLVLAWEKVSKQTYSHNSKTFLKMLACIFYECCGYVKDNFSGFGAAQKEAGLKNSELFPLFSFLCGNKMGRLFMLVFFHPNFSDATLSKYSRNILDCVAAETIRITRHDIPRLRDILQKFIDLRLGFHEPGKESEKEIGRLSVMCSLDSKDFENLLRQSQQQPRIAAPPRDTALGAVKESGSSSAASGTPKATPRGVPRDTLVSGRGKTSLSTARKSPRPEFSYESDKCMFAEHKHPDKLDGFGLCVTGGAMKKFATPSGACKHWICWKHLELYTTAKQWYVRNYYALPDQECKITDKSNIFLCCGWLYQGKSECLCYKPKAVRTQVYNMLTEISENKVVYELKDGSEPVLLSKQAMEKAKAAFDQKTGATSDEMRRSSDTEARRAAEVVAAKSSARSESPRSPPTSAAAASAPAAAVVSDPGDKTSFTQQNLRQTLFRITREQGVTDPGNYILVLSNELKVDYQKTDLRKTLFPEAKNDDERIEQFLQLVESMRSHPDNNYDRWNELYVSPVPKRVDSARASVTVTARDVKMYLFENCKTMTRTELLKKVTEKFGNYDIHATFFPNASNAREKISLMTKMLDSMKEFKGTYDEWRKTQSSPRNPEPSPHLQPNVAGQGDGGATSVQIARGARGQEEVRELEGGESSRGSGRTREKEKYLWDDVPGLQLGDSDPVCIAIGSVYKDEENHVLQAQGGLIPNILAALVQVLNANRTEKPHLFPREAENVVIAIITACIRAVARRVHQFENIPHEELGIASNAKEMAQMYEDSDATGKNNYLAFIRYYQEKLFSKVSKATYERLLTGNDHLCMMGFIIGEGAHMKYVIRLLLEMAIPIKVSTCAAGQDPEALFDPQSFSSDSIHPAYFQCRLSKTKIGCVGYLDLETFFGEFTNHGKILTAFHWIKNELRSGSNIFLHFSDAEKYFSNAERRGKYSIFRIGKESREEPLTRDSAGGQEVKTFEENDFGCEITDTRDERHFLLDITECDYDNYSRQELDLFRKYNTKRNSVISVGNEVYYLDIVGSINAYKISRVNERATINRFVSDKDGQFNSDEEFLFPTFQEANEVRQLCVAIGSMKDDSEDAARANKTPRKRAPKKGAPEEEAPEQGAPEQEEPEQEEPEQEEPEERPLTPSTPSACESEESSASKKELKGMLVKTLEDYILLKRRVIRLLPYLPKELWSTLLSEPEDTPFSKGTYYTGKGIYPLFIRNKDCAEDEILILSHPRNDPDKFFTCYIKVKLDDKYQITEVDSTKHDGRETYMRSFTRYQNYRRITDPASLYTANFEVLRVTPMRSHGGV